VHVQSLLLAVPVVEEQVVQALTALVRETVAEAEEEPQAKTEKLTTEVAVTVKPVLNLDPVLGQPQTALVLEFL
jgi:hypothetical protein